MSDRQLLKALRAAKREPGDPGRTAKELAIELFGRDTKGTRALVWGRLGTEIDARRVEAGRGMRQNRANVWHGEPVYRWVE